MEPMSEVCQCQVKFQASTDKLCKYKVHIIKWTISGELSIGLESHWDLDFRSYRPLFLDGYCE